MSFSEKLVLDQVPSLFEEFVSFVDRLWTYQLYATALAIWLKSLNFISLEKDKFRLHSFVVRKIVFNHINRLSTVACIIYGKYWGKIEIYVKKKCTEIFKEQRQKYRSRNGGFFETPLVHLCVIVHENKTVYSNLTANQNHRNFFLYDLRHSITRTTHTIAKLGMSRYFPKGRKIPNYCSIKSRKLQR